MALTRCLGLETDPPRDANCRSPRISFSTPARCGFARIPAMGQSALSAPSALGSLLASPAWGCSGWGRRRSGSHARSLIGPSGGGLRGSACHAIRNSEFHSSRCSGAGFFGRRRNAPTDCLVRSRPPTHSVIGLWPRQDLFLHRDTSVPPEICSPARRSTNYGLYDTPTYTPTRCRKG